jgi:hypothetical protein
VLDNATTPLELKTEINDYLVSFKLTSDFKVNDSKATITACKGSYIKIKCSPTEFNYSQKYNGKNDEEPFMEEADFKAIFNDLSMGININRNGDRITLFFTDTITEKSADYNLHIMSS